MSSVSFVWIFFIIVGIILVASIIIAICRCKYKGHEGVVIQGGQSRAGLYQQQTQATNDYPEELRVSLPDVSYSSTVQPQDAPPTYDEVIDEMFGPDIETEVTSNTRVSPSASANTRNEPVVNRVSNIASNTRMSSDNSINTTRYPSVSNPGIPSTLAAISVQPNVRSASTSSRTNHHFNAMGRNKHNNEQRTRSGNVRQAGMSRQTRLVPL